MAKQTTQPITADINYKAIFTNLPNTYMVIKADDPTFTIVAESEAHARMSMGEGKWAIGMPFFEAFPDTSETFAKTGDSLITRSLRRVIKTKQPDPMDVLRYDIKNKDGVLEERYWRATHYPILDSKGRVEYIFQDTKDITEEVRVNDKLQRTEAQLSEALSIGQVGSWVWNIDNDVVVADRHLASLFGIETAESSVELPLKSFTDSIFEEDRARVTAAIEIAVKSGNEFEQEYRTTRVDGTIRWVIARGRVERDEQGTARTFPGVIVDITDRKVAEARYSQQLTLTNTIATSLGEGVYALDTEGKVTFINQAAQDLLGWTADELQGERVHEKVHFQTAWGKAFPASKCETLQVIKTGKPVLSDETTFTRKDGTTFTANFTSVPIKRGETVVGVVQSFTDISERKQAELNLRFLANASTIFASTLDARTMLRNVAKKIVPEIADWCVVNVLAADKTLQQIAVTHKDSKKIALAKQYLAENPVDLEGDSGVATVIRTGKPAFYPIITKQMLEESSTSREQLGQLLALEFTSVIIVPLKDEDTSIGTIMLVSSDTKRRYTPNDLEMATELANRASLAMTNARLYQTARNELIERERLEAELRLVNEELEQRVAIRTSELEASNTNLQRSNQELQDFAYVASHDLQEPLRKIQAFSNLLSNEYAAKLGDGQDYLDRMKNAAARMSSLIEDLLSFSRVTTKANPFQPVNLEQIAREVVGDLETRLDETGGSVIIKPLPTINADPLQMRQLLQNLIGNALKFARDGVAPVVTVSAQTTRRKDGSINKCTLKVADNGIGFDERYTDRIFAVFQRLHGREKYPGTGIGLAICRKIAERHGGTINAQSALGEGSTFTVVLSPNNISEA